MNAAPAIESSIDTHAPHWLGRLAFPVVTALFFLSQASLGFALYRADYWLAVPLALFSSHLMHGMMIGFHEASHGLLRKSRLLNEIDGILIGIFSLMSFSLYRAAHQSHHAYLASERDEELWPFVHPQMPKWARILAAVIELTMGFLFTPFLFLRAFLRDGSPIRNRKLRRRVWTEFAGMTLIWISLLTAVAVFDAWKYLLWIYLIPAWMAGNMQSLRKYVEHVGLTGSTVNSSTRSIMAEGWVARFVNFTLLHEPFHGVHHWRSGLPHPELPEHAAALEPKGEQERPPFRTFGAALYDLFQNLADPRVGAQWLGAAPPKRPETGQSKTKPMAVPDGGSDVVFEAGGLKKEYDDGQVQALRGVDFCIRQGEFVAIVGQSGSGKSTLLQMLGALDRPSSGTLKYRGASLQDRADLTSYRAREIGFIFQAFHLLPTFTALENVQIPMFGTHRSVSERKNRAVELLKAVGLEARLNHRPGKLSGGERQRVAIARSLANGASVLLADEPTGNLDSENAAIILDLIMGLRSKQNLTLILVTHDMGIARKAERIIQMKDGHILSDAPNNQPA